MKFVTAHQSFILIATSMALGLSCACDGGKPASIPPKDNAIYAGPNQTGEQAVTGFTVINANTGVGLSLLNQNDTLMMVNFPVAVTLRADTSPAEVGSVRFDFDGRQGYRTANAPPYTLDASGGTSWTMTSSAHTVTATPFSEAGLQGIRGAALTINFTVDANAPGDANQTQNTNVTNPNATYNPNLPVTHIYDFANGVNDTSPTAPGRVNGTLVSASISGNVLVSQSTTSATGMLLPTQVFAHYTGSFTIEQWFTWAQVTGDYESLFSVSVDTDHTLMAHPKRADDGLFSVDLHPGNGQQYSVTGPAPAADTLTFMAYVYDATANGISLYINGAQTDTLSLPVAVDLSALAGVDYTGVGGFSPFGDPGFNGTTRRFVVQPVALTAQEVAADTADPNAAGMP